MCGRVWGYLLVFLMGVAGGHSALAHPMGNFSINHYAGIHVERDGVELRYIVDFAEIPTYQEIQDAGIVAQVGGCFAGTVPGEGGRGVGAGAASLR